MTTQHDLEHFSSNLSIRTTRPLSDLFILDDNIPFHATRILLLIKLAGRPINNPRIEGRTKLAKLDFFIRYPKFLDNAAQLLLSRENYETIHSILIQNPTIESQMIRYKYGPWDQRYYLVLAYLSGKGLIEVRPTDKADQYTLTEIGNTLASNLMQLDVFNSIVARSRLVGEIFGQRNGTWIKKFIYRNFPEVVRTPYTHLIGSALEEGEN
jgi:hypothetical protein